VTADAVEVEVVLAHTERATLRVGDVFLKIDSDQTRTDVEVAAMAMACPFDLAILTLAHEKNLGDVRAGYGTDVDRDLIRAWWSWRCLVVVRWLFEHALRPDRDVSRDRRVEIRGPKQHRPIHAERAPQSRESACDVRPSLHDVEARVPRGTVYLQHKLALGRTGAPEMDRLVVLQFAHRFDLPETRASGS
jgi:hypothetical protein